VATPTQLPTTRPEAHADDETTDVPADPDEAYRQALEGAQTVAVAEAQRLLAQVMAELRGAQKSFAATSVAADQARKTDEQAQQQLHLAEESAARTQREIVELAVRTGHTRETLGVVAREAYQGSSLAALGVVLAAETPTQLTNRYVGMRTLLRTGDTALSHLAVDQANLRNAHARLEGQRDQMQDRADVAGKSRAAMENAAQVALQAQANLDNKSDLVAAALEAAEKAKLEDYRRYMELLNQSTAIGEELTRIDYGPGFGTGTFMRPAIGQVTSGYGMRLHPILGYVKMHTGLDFARGDGLIYAADSGTVIEAKWNNAYGNMVIIDHGDLHGQRLTTVYAHQRDLIVSPGQRVEKGQVIGNIGATGYATGPHLHFEVRLDGQHTDPSPWIADAPLPGS
jgi:murein DD-endopeptidase MepM/ murein hydrolase activator NlpD